MSFLLKNSFRIFNQALLCLAVVGVTNAQTPTRPSANKQVLLPNGWSLSPAGRSIALGDLPLNMALSANKKLLAVTNNGQSTQFLQLIDPKTEKQLDSVSIAKSWYGLKFSNDDTKLYVSGGNDNIIISFTIKNKKFTKPDTIKLGEAWPKEKISPAGIDVDNKNNRLYTVTKEDSSLYIVDLITKKTIRKLKLSHEAYACVLSPDKSELYISIWGGDKLAVYDIKQERMVAAIITENHPNEILTTKKGEYIFVANANDNSVSIINRAQRKVIETISATLFPTKLTGSTTNGLALSADEKSLYIANADNNCLSVFNVSQPGKSVSMGFIPTGWYPTNVKTVNNKILVSNGKGFSSMPNPQGPQPVKKTDNSGSHLGNTNSRLQYIGGLFKGTLSFIDQPNAARLNTYSKQVYANTPFNKAKENEAHNALGNPVPAKPGDKSPIKHVFYVIKENRTYDQVLGDMPEGNGDTSLCIFPEKITPNHHALARQFVLLDNFYVDAEVSADGHNWSTAAYANDYVEKTWPISYGNRGGTYDYEGSRKIAYPRDGFIWDYCNRAGVSYRSYGEFTSTGKASIKSLEGKICVNYPSYNLDIKDVDRIKVFKHDFDSLLAVGQVPQFNTIRIGNDHTSGQRKGKLSPISMVADNDLALGQLIEHISNSPVWKESAIFVLEDDAQNGPDHVDAHRSPAFVISPYIKMGSVNHTMYSTSGMLRTMELILGLPPMSQYDAAAKPLFDCFSNQPDLTAYKLRSAGVSLDVKNTANNTSAIRSEAFDFSREDLAPDLDLNEVVWKYVKGENSIMPAPKRSAFVKLEAKADDDDD
ncbi:bifunctional YncE family protein/alkaline phosphatase family protein [Pedobacter sp. P351]|uniref:bifunctional YncE family protein/alkaline phosphatase family protein n=1 Tax=Pedobacter superstes TaxID=3133441 RepID=UPI0030A62F2B